MPHPETLDELIADPNAPTDKQQAILAQFRQPIPATKAEATRAIAKIAAGGWAIPTVDS